METANPKHMIMLIVFPSKIDGPYDSFAAHGRSLPIDGIIEGDGSDWTLVEPILTMRRGEA